MFFSMSELFGFRVSDGSASGDVSITVNVQDINDNSPTFAKETLEIEFDTSGIDTGNH